MIGIDEAELIRVLEKGEIPVLVLKEESGKLSLHVDGTTKTIPYITISHVWADGLGNPDANEIPTCQARNLYTALTQQMHNAEPQWSSQEWGKWIQALQEHEHEAFAPTPKELVARPNETLPFWLDTLCIPVNNSFQPLRELSLSRMKSIYHSALSTLVLDSDLSTLPPSSAPLLILSSLLISDWRQRLWTYQEGSMSREIFIKGSSSIFRLRPSMGILKGLIEDISANIHCTEIPYKIYFRLNRLVLNDGLRDIGLSSDLSVQRAIAAVSDRVTSRSGDESIVLAACLGLDPSPLHPLPPELRMVKVMRLLSPHIPINILFASGPRHVEIPLFSWLPKTFLSPHGVHYHLVASVVNIGSENPILSMRAFPPGRLTEFGLYASLPFIELGTDPAAKPDYSASRFYFSWRGSVIHVEIQERFCSPEEFVNLADENLILLLSAPQPYSVVPALLVHWDGQMGGGAFEAWEQTKVVRPIGLAKLRWVEVPEDEMERIESGKTTFAREGLRGAEKEGLVWKGSTRFLWESWFLI